MQALSASARRASSSTSRATSARVTSCASRCVPSPVRGAARAAAAPPRSPHLTSPVRPPPPSRMHLQSKQSEKQEQWTTIEMEESTEVRGWEFTRLNHPARAQHRTPLGCSLSPRCAPRPRPCLATPACDTPSFAAHVCAALPQFFHQGNAAGVVRVALLVQGGAAHGRVQAGGPGCVRVRGAQAVCSPAVGRKQGRSLNARPAPPRRVLLLCVQVTCGSSWRLSWTARTSKTAGGRKEATLCHAHDRRGLGPPSCATAAQIAGPCAWPI